MNTVDQRILIPASPEVIWQYISDIQNNPRWQADCRSVSWLTTIHDAKGARWRYTTEGGRDCVVEISAWYDRVGYEYRIVDGVPYDENIGRIRLQETPEGTIVQWVFSYEMSGPFSGLRNAISTRRKVENDVVESLWELWRQTSKEGRSAVSYTSKSLMREAPDVEARAQYTPRHPTTTNLAERLAAEESPVAEDDTKPNEAIAQTPGAPEETFPSRTWQRPPQPSWDNEPDFLSEIAEEPPERIDPHRSTKMLPVTPSEETEPVTEDVQFVAEERKADLTAPLEESITEPSEPPTPEADSPFQLDRLEEQSDYTPPPTEPDRQQVAPSEVDPTLDTSKMSVFDIFGLPKPSKTQEIRAIANQEIEAVPSEPEAQPTPAPPVISTGEGPRGLRILLRQQSVKVRQRK